MLLPSRSRPVDGSQPEKEISVPLIKGEARDRFRPGFVGTADWCLAGPAVPEVSALRVTHLPVSFCAAGLSWASALCRVRFGVAVIVLFTLVTQTAAPAMSRAITPV